MSQMIPTPEYYASPAMFSPDGGGMGSACNSARFTTKFLDWETLERLSRSRAILCGLACPARSSPVDLQKQVRIQRQ
jgi:hypothetical protein